MKNTLVAELLRNIAQLLEIKGEIIFKIRAYEKAALVIENLEGDIEEIWKKGKLDDIPGVGEALTKKISEAVNIPVIASGGGGLLPHFADAFKEGKADAALAASIFHYGEYTVKDIKNYLKENGIVVRE